MMCNAYSWAIPAGNTHQPDQTTVHRLHLFPLNMAAPKLAQLIAVMMLLLVVLMATDSSGTQVTIRACGESLSSILYAFCKGKFAGFKQHKRGSLDLFDYVDQQQELEQEQEQQQQLGWRWPHGTRHDMLMTTRRLNRGVVDECCLKPCSNTEMEAFCKH